MPCDSVAVRTCQTDANLAALALTSQQTVQAVCNLLGQGASVSYVRPGAVAVLYVAGVRVVIGADGSITSSSDAINQRVQTALGQIGGAMLQAKIAAILKSRYAATSDTVAPGGVRVVTVEV